MFSTNFVKKTEKFRYVFCQEFKCFGKGAPRFGHSPGYLRVRMYDVNVLCITMNKK